MDGAFMAVSEFSGRIFSAANVAHLQYFQISGFAGYENASCEYI
jgi:hypothetical protein